MENFVLVERMLIESLGKNAKNSCQISEDTGLDALVVTNILSDFLDKKYISFSNGLFSLTPLFLEKNLEKHREIKSKKFELKSLFSSVLNNVFSGRQAKAQTHLKLKKVWLTEEEERILQTQLRGLDLFFESVTQKRKTSQNKKDQRLADKKVVFWGSCQYSDLADASLRVS